MMEQMLAKDLAALGLFPPLRTSREPRLSRQHVHRYTWLHIGIDIYGVHCK